MSLFRTDRTIASSGIIRVHKLQPPTAMVPIPQSTYIEFLPLLWLAADPPPLPPSRPDVFATTGGANPGSVTQMTPMPCSNPANTMPHHTRDRPAPKPTAPSSARSHSTPHPTATRHMKPHHTTPLKVYLSMSSHRLHWLLSFPPSIWCAAVDTPHKNPSGNRSWSTPVSPFRWCHFQ